MIDPRASDAVAVLSDQCVGRVVDRVLVHGINALKTADPPLTSLGGHALKSATASTGSLLEMAVGPFVLVVDLQRTGRLKLDGRGKEWSVGQTSMPTVQMIFADGPAANFIEPAKTKRIALRVERRS